MLRKKNSMNRRWTIKMQNQATSAALRKLLASEMGSHCNILEGL
jgi:hypothetical protein